MINSLKNALLREWDNKPSDHISAACEALPYQLDAIRARSSIAFVLKCEMFLDILKFSKDKKQNYKITKSQNFLPLTLPSADPCIITFNLTLTKYPFLKASQSFLLVDSPQSPLEMSHGMLST